MVYHEQYSRYVGMVEETLERVLPQTQDVFSKNEGVIPAHLCESMRYSLLAGGKRVRPVLLLAACDMLQRIRTILTVMCLPPRRLQTAPVWRA